MECKIMFFNIFVFFIVSKWWGDLEKFVKVFFELVCYFVLSIIFLDEIDVLISIRGEGFSEYEVSRWFKIEFFV